MRLRFAALGAALGLALTLAAPTTAGAQSAHAAQGSPTSLRHFQAEPGAWQTGAWETYKSRFVMPDGRVVDDGNGGISHSEGQGYAMLLAVLANDAGAFNRIWTWTKKELYTRPDGLASWRWEPDKTPRITDPNNASDGDLLIAWALAEASDRWARPEWAREAVRIGPVVNLSYWVFPAFDSLKRVAPSIDWSGYRASGLSLLRHARFGSARLPPDWISIAKGRVEIAEGFPPTFSYNALRIPLYLAWAGFRSPEHLGAYAAFMTASGGRLREVNLKSSEFAEPIGDAGYLAIFALTACLVNQTPIPPALRSVSFDRYYPATLHMLSLAAARLRYAECL
jgi:endo-1,4-beta-D-glucanase Y